MKINNINIKDKYRMRKVKDNKEKRKIRRTRKTRNRVARNRKVMINKEITYKETARKKRTKSKNKRRWKTMISINMNLKIIETGNIHIEQFVFVLIIINILFVVLSLIFSKY